MLPVTKHRLVSQPEGYCLLVYMDPMGFSFRSRSKMILWLFLKNRVRNGRSGRAHLLGSMLLPEADEYGFH
jgi:hypothetical protein